SGLDIEYWLFGYISCNPNYLNYPNNCGWGAGRAVQCPTISWAADSAYTGGPVDSCRLDVPGIISGPNTSISNLGNLRLSGYSRSGYDEVYLSDSSNGKASSVSSGSSVL